MFGELGGKADSGYDQTAIVAAVDVVARMRARRWEIAAVVSLAVTLAVATVALIVAGGVSSRLWPAALCAASSVWCWFIGWKYRHVVDVMRSTSWTNARIHGRPRGFRYRRTTVRFTVVGGVERTGEVRTAAGSAIERRFDGVVAVLPLRDDQWLIFSPADHDIFFLHDRSSR